LVCQIGHKSAKLNICAPNSASLESVEYIYMSKIKASIEELIKPCSSCGKVHGDNPDKLTNLSSEIEHSINQIKESLT
jgi:iron-sulfur cluster repair protein YtfE (RIC family)